MLLIQNNQETAPFRRFKTKKGTLFYFSLILQ
jgi:hypothetical protein